MSLDSRGTELEMFVWVDHAHGTKPPLYSISRGQRGVCVNLPLEAALARIREELTAATVHCIDVMLDTHGSRALLP